jgi:photosystem II stability/assembly factor-like uncharacterized protein
MPRQRHNALAAGSLLQQGRYILEAVLGAGGFGITYRARDTLLDRTVAIKELCSADSERVGDRLSPPDEYDATAWELEISAFLREARAIAGLDHAGIVRIYDYFKENNTAYNVMQFVDGISLATLLAQRGGSLPQTEVLRYVAAAGEALAALHEKGILHRDIKPPNIMLSQQGSIVLIDFGAARQFVADQIISHTVIATYGFAPPEQFHPRARRGPSSDIYSLAVTCYFLLTGDLPNPQDDRRVNPRILAAIEHATEYNPADRPQTVAAFLAELAGKSIQTIVDKAPTFDQIAERFRDLIPDAIDLLDSIEEPPVKISEWLMVDSPTGVALQSLAMPSDDQGWAVGEAGALIHYHDGRWLDVGSAASNLCAIQMLNPDCGWAVGWYGTVMRYRKGEWVKIDLPTSEHLQGVYMTGPHDGWAVGRHGILFSCRAGNWKVAPSPLRLMPERDEWGRAPMIGDVYGIPDLNAICMVSTLEGWAVGENGTMMRYFMGHWGLADSPTDKTLQAVQMLSADCGWVVGWEGTILRYDGKVWETVECPSRAYLFGLHMTAPDEGWATGSTGTIMRCTAGRWQEVVSPTAEPLRGLAVTPNGDAWIVGYFGYILHREGQELAR